MATKKTKKPKTKQVISLAIPFEIKEELLKRRHYTLFVQSLIEDALGRCPSCKQKWPGKLEK